MTSKGIFEVSSFVGPEAKGNQHVVLIGHVDQQECVALSYKVSPKILVVMDEPSHSCPNVQFLKSGRPILRCGSGSLAVAYILHRYYSFIGEYEVSTSVGRIVLGCLPNAYYFQSSVYPLRKNTNVLSWPSILNKPVIDVREIGPRNGYYLLELPNEKSVKDCRVKGAALSRVSRRAVIVTAKSDRMSDDYVMRYFAPQYSQHEDPATGSANAMLAEYWQKKLKKQKIVGRQLSRNQGQFCLIKKGLSQRVIGQAVLNESDFEYSK